jgi:acyl-CoA thioester hydrolase
VSRTEKEASMTVEPTWFLLRFRDLDAFGHVYHAEYLTLLDEARAKWFGDVMGLTNPSDYVVVHLEIDYDSSLTRADHAVRVEFVLERLGTTSLTLGETMHAQDDRVVARSRTVVVLRDVTSGRSRSLEGGERSRAEDLLSHPRRGGG